MKKYTIHFIVIAIVTGLIGFSGFDIPGISAFRVISLIAFIFIFISCLDAVLLVRKNRRDSKTEVKGVENLELPKEEIL